MKNPLYAYEPIKISFELLTILLLGLFIYKSHFAPAIISCFTLTGAIITGVASADRKRKYKEIKQC
jgi:hypothetical protein